MVSEFIIFNEEHLVKEKRRKDGTRNENVIESKELKRSENIRKKKGGIFMVLFLEYPKCSTCKKAKKWLVKCTVSKLAPPLGGKLEKVSVVLEK